MINQNPNQQGIAGLPELAMQQLKNDPNNTMGKMATAGGEGVMSTGSVNQTADAYRGRIPELQKKYQMTQDLIYLLAMQQLKGEKEAAIRSVEMKAEVPPKTIMAQRDKEVSDLTGAQMKHIASVGAEAGATQAKQKQQMDQQKMMQGIGGAPNQTQYAAGGGLVSFVNGGQATDSGAVTTGMEKRLLDQGINVRAIAERNGVDPELVLRVIQAESSGDPNAISSAGAIGYMQLMPTTAEGLGVDPNDPVQNVEGGVRYLSQMLKKYDGDERLALAAYNAGPGTVDRYIRSNPGTSGIPQIEETQNYVAKIMGSRGNEIDTYIEPSRNQSVNPYPASTSTPVGDVAADTNSSRKSRRDAFIPPPSFQGKNRSGGLRPPPSADVLGDGGRSGRNRRNFQDFDPLLDSGITPMEDTDPNRYDEVPTAEVPTAKVQEGIASVAQPESKGMTLEDMLAFQQGGDKKLTNVDKIIAGLKGMGGSGLSGISAGLDYEQGLLDIKNKLEADKRSAALAAFSDQEKRLSTEKVGMESARVQRERNASIDLNNRADAAYRIAALTAAQEEKRADTQLKYQELMTAWQEGAFDFDTKRRTMINNINEKIIKEKDPVKREVLTNQLQNVVNDAYALYEIINPRPNESLAPEYLR